MAITVGRLKALLGMEELSFNLEGRQVEERGDHVVEHLRFRLSDGGEVRGFLVRPSERRLRRPAVLHCHAHGGRYDIGAAELIEGRPALLDPPGPALAREGHVVLSIDMPTFGARAHEQEDAASKAALWDGKTLFGRMLAEQTAALVWLARHPEVDPKRIAVSGLSMGATLAYFLAAVDAGVAATAHFCCYADMASLIRSGAHDLHGYYMTVPGLLRETSTGEIASLVAPRPQLICVGEEDPLTLPDAVAVALAQTREAYETAGAPNGLVFLSEPGAGHKETPAMRRALLAFLRHYP
ncbi:alpha/beta hydrolase family protein [Pseudorhizobium flavum]|uniref:Dienelactone hydrolase n=1 Tax=Pseudorhizobium flavum TaxID=1335061 RepID=A0A7W9YX34_9HYPH|nr:dienelactone hydrolase family protein [Pseudorhizobium flavum]MBB6180012.1 dienelactone hydrolase [Pseudorhizobium flavum]CAD6616999.1 hydrolase [Pseudorhizobium flavum]